MKLYGSLERLVNLVFRKNGNNVTLRPNQSTTYTASRDIQLPPGDAAHILMSADSTATLTNKTFDANGTGNSLSNVDVADLSAAFVLTVAKGGTNSSASLNNNRVMQSSGGAIVEAAAITASRALISDANGIPTHSATTSTELGYVSGVTSAIQTQLNAKQADVITTEGDLVVGDASGDPVRLPIGTSGYVLTSDGDTASWQPAGAGFDSFAANWINADGATKVVTHNLGTKDVQVEIYDTDDDSTVWIDSVVRTDTNSVTLTSSEAPAVTWRVTVHAV